MIIHVTVVAKRVEKLVANTSLGENKIEGYFQSDINTNKLIRTLD